MLIFMPALCQSNIVPRNIHMCSMHYDGELQPDDLYWKLCQKSKERLRRNEGQLEVSFEGKLAVHMICNEL